VVHSAFGYQGQKCSACSRAIVDAAIYDEFLEKLKAKADRLTVGLRKTRRITWGR
jgi:1-pyrroline-5-carboxylate dehydrogenase